MNSVSDLQVQLHQVIDSIQDEEKLMAIHTILKGSSGPFSSMTMDEYINFIDESRDQIRAGRFTSVEDLEKESDNW
ncbi:MAG: hypothetical protein RLN88_04585 [Ekhidna sp.]|uniref:hypothetical protein n=1 Tax=Ekhidna sp. TaxID=2608089 RepID=UPI0032EDF0DC